MELLRVEQLAVSAARWTPWTAPDELAGGARLENSENAALAIDSEHPKGKSPDSRETRKLGIWKPWSLDEVIELGMSFLLSFAGDVRSNA